MSEVIINVTKRTPWGFGGERIIPLKKEVVRVIINVIKRTPWGFGR